MSTGIILYEVASRKLPYHEHRSLRVMELMMSVLRGENGTQSVGVLSGRCVYRGQSKHYAPSLHPSTVSDTSFLVPNGWNGPYT